MVRGKAMRLTLLSVLSLFVSCASTSSNAYLPDLPPLEDVPKGKPQSEREAILERNYIELAKWAEIVWRGNR